MHDSCESCGREDELVEVIRVYLVRDDDGTERPLDAGGELWCASCRATYPHREAR